MCSKKIHYFIEKDKFLSLSKKKKKKKLRPIQGSTARLITRPEVKKCDYKKLEIDNDTCNVMLLINSQQLLWVIGPHCRDVHMV